MRKIVLTSALTAFLTAAAMTGANVWAASSHPTYPAACTRVVSCVDNHLNNLDARLHANHTKLVALQNQVQADEGRLACYGDLNVVQYPSAPGGGNSPTALGNTRPNGTDTDINGNQGTWLDLEHFDSPASNPVYHLVRDWCAN